MTDGGNKEPGWQLSEATIDLAIRFGIIALLGYWSAHVISPFLTIGGWSAILAVALYPLFDRLAGRVGPRVAASLITLLCLAIVIGPVMWLGFGMISGIETLLAELNSGQLAIPFPPESVRTWPVIGARVHELWVLAATNMKAALSEVSPTLKPVGAKLLGMSESAFFGLLELLVSIVIAGFLFSRGPQLIDALSVILGRALGLHGKKLVQLAGATIRNVSRGVIGISFLQAFLAGAGFLVAGIPGASVLAFLTLLLGIIQIGPTILFIPIVVWSWLVMETANALMFTAFMVPVGLIDNALRPLLMGRGLTTPMPVILIGIIGGTIAYGIVGLFFGPIVLSVVWAVTEAWVQGDIARESRS
jgi:predicted PurR-regulated permease PerM